MINLKLNTQQAQSLLESNQAKEKEIKEQISLLRTELNSLSELNKLIREQIGNDGAQVISGNTTVVVSAGKTEYNPSWTNAQKVAFVLKGSSAPMTTRSIVDSIVKADPAADPKRVMRSISSVLSVGASGEKPIYIKSLNERNDNTYQLKQ